MNNNRKKNKTVKVCKTDNGEQKENHTHGQQRNEIHFDQNRDISSTLCNWARIERPLKNNQLQNCVCFY